MKDLREIRLFLLDMDGTIYLDHELFDGTIDFLEYVRSIGGRYMFLTNNSSKNVDDYIKKRRNMGISTEREDFLTSTDATIRYLQSKDYKKIYVLGTVSFQRQIEESGFTITDNLAEDIDCLCMGYDTELTYKKLEDACILLRNNIAYVATNPDWVCPTWYGYAPDCGSICEMLFRATGKKPYFVGKPRPDMINLALERTGYDKAQTVIIGDRLYTDIACGVNADITSIFVLSGEGVVSDIEKYNVTPTFIFDNIKKLYAALKDC